MCRFMLFVFPRKSTVVVFFPDYKAILKNNKISFCALTLKFQASAASYLVFH